MRLIADSKADLDRFVRRVAEGDEVWSLASAQGVAWCESNEFEDDDGDAPAVLLFFSDRAYATRAQAAQFPAHAPEAIPLFDFMYRWLPGMSGDGVLAGPNWSGDLTGLELDPFELRELIEAAMTPEHVARHVARCAELKAGGGG
jgi:hypothetical protein